MTVTAEMRENEPFRWCVYCDVDCEIGEEHLATCASVTGLYPVRENDLVFNGPDGPEYHGMMCSMDGCSTVFEIGDHYMLKTLEEEDPFKGGLAGASVSLTVCVPCAVEDHFAPTS